MNIRFRQFFNKLITVYKGKANVQLPEAATYCYHESNNDCLPFKTLNGFSTSFPLGVLPLKLS